jgi:hypothetical protein
VQTQNRRLTEKNNISIANLLFMIFCSDLAKIWINKYRIHECHCDTPVCMIIFNCLYAIYIMNYFILSPRGRAVWLTHFPGEGGGINALESCFFKVPGCPGGVPPGQAVDMCIILYQIWKLLHAHDLFVFSAWIINACTILTAVSLSSCTYIINNVQYYFLCKREEYNDRTNWKLHSWYTSLFHWQ